MAHRKNDFQTIRSEGGLLPPDLLRRVLDPKEKIPGTRSEDYGLPQGERLNEVITQSWSRLRRHWTEFRAALGNLPDGEPGTGLTNDKWSLPVLRELGFGLLPTSSSPVVSGRSYAINRFYGYVPIHLVGSGLSLDRRAAGVRGAAAANPHGLVQDFLNRSTEHLWAIVSNGLRLRILRDNQALSRQSFLEFDLEAMFAGEVYSDFVLLWLTAHATRFTQHENLPCWLEQWTKIANEQGTRALGDLRKGVEKALQILGEGFTSNPKNTLLRDALRTGQLQLVDFHGQLLRVVYRLIFLSVAEDRSIDGQSLLHPRDNSKVGRLARERYAAHYSTARLREMAAKIKGSRHGDLWRQFQILVRALSANDKYISTRENLALPSLGSFLWNPASTAALNNAELTNHDFLEALRHLAFTHQGKVLRPVDYKNLGAEELGGVYESLLALTPQINADGARFTFAEFAGNERKTSGSYYTPDSLVQCVLDSALDPVVEEAVKGKVGQDAEKAILSLKVCDPAVGSGHFLVGAAHRLARHLARARTLAQGESEPSPLLYQHALREVIGRCLYGVDINPMAAELCRVSLWLEALEPGKPLSFLDHHIRVGNSLLGTTPELIAKGLPDDAFNSIEGDDREVCSKLKKKNKQERDSGQQDMMHMMVAEQSAEYGSIEAQTRGLDDIPDITFDDVQRKAEQFHRLVLSPEYQHAQQVADTWCAAFVWNMQSDAPFEAITTDTIRRLEANANALVVPQRTEVERLSRQHQFFHWHLAFPEVFSRGGFDCVLGNPPWDTLSPDAKEFFSAFDPSIREAKKSDQEIIIGRLLELPSIKNQWAVYRRNLFALVHFLKQSGQFVLFAHGNLGKGDFDLYRVFVELALRITRHGGYSAQLVKSGIYNGANAQAIRKELFDHWQWKIVLGFVNTGKKWFPAIHAETRFALYAASKGGTTKEISAGFGLTSPEKLATCLRNLTPIPIDTIYEQSPEALAIPETNSVDDILLSGRMQRRWPAFGDKNASKPHRHYQREIDMGNDRNLFSEDPSGLPLYEGRMIDHFDHRAKAYRSGRGRSAIWETLPFGNPNKAIVPQWYIPHNAIPDKLGDRTAHYRVVWCDIATPTAARSLVAALVPPGVICGHKTPTFRFEPENEWAYMPWLAVANSLCMDYLLRKKLALCVSFTLLDSLPFPKFTLGDELAKKIGVTALHLTCTSPEMTAYWNATALLGWCQAEEVGRKPPGIVDSEERVCAIAEIDAIVAKQVFQLNRTEFEFVIDSFDVLKKQEESEFGEFRTKRLVLEAYDRLDWEESLVNAWFDVRKQQWNYMEEEQVFPWDGREAFVYALIPYLIQEKPGAKFEFYRDAALLASHPENCETLLLDDKLRNEYRLLKKGIALTTFPKEHRVRPRKIREKLQNKKIIVTRADSGSTVINDIISLPPLPPELKVLLPLILMAADNLEKMQQGKLKEAEAEKDKFRFDEINKKLALSVA